MNAVVTTVAQPTLTANAVVLMLTTTAAWCATRPNTRRGRRGPSRRAGGPPPVPHARTPRMRGVGMNASFRNPMKGHPQHD